MPWLPLKTDVLMWLLLPFFLFHNFEEIIMLMPWMRKNNPLMHKSNAWFAEKYKKIVAHYSTPSLATMGGLYALLIIIPILVTVELKLYSVYIGILIAYGFHLLIHFIEFALIRDYIPMIFTSFFSAAYVIVTLHDLAVTKPIDWVSAAITAVIASAVYLFYIYFANLMSKFFENWLVKKFLA